MKSQTISDLRKHDPCYDPTRFLPEDWSGTAVDILKIRTYPAADRIWMVTRPGLFYSDKQLRIFACNCADRALARVKNPDQRSLDAVKIAKRYAEGKATKDELNAAAADAAAAADDAAYAAAADVDAADAAAAYAAADAAYAAAYAADAADVDAADAAAAAAYADATYEREVQIQELIKLTETGETRSVTKHKEAT